MISKSARIQIAVTAGLYLLLQGVSIWFDQYATLTENSDPHHRCRVHRRQRRRSPAARSSPASPWSSPSSSSSPPSSAAGACRSSAPRCSSCRASSSASLLPVDRPALPGRPERAVARGASTSSAASTSTRDGLRGRRRREDRLRGDDGRRARRAARGRRDHGEHPHHGPAGDQPTRSRSSSSSASTTSSPTPLDVDRYEIDGAHAGHRDRGARAQLAGLGDADDLVQHAHSSTRTATASWPRRATSARSTASPCSSSRGIPSTGSLGELRAARLLRRGLAGLLDRRRARGQPTRSSSTTRRAATASSRPRPRSRATAGPSSTTCSTKLVYALKFQSEQIFLSDASTTDSQILYDRDPIERVQKVAPYLTLDSDTVPGGRRRAHRLDRRRLHAHRPTTRTRTR